MSPRRLRGPLPWVCAGLLALGALITTVSAMSSGRRATDAIALGAYIADGSLAPCDAAAIDRFAALTGRRPAIVMWYQDWAGSDAGFSAQCLNNAFARHAMPMVTWEPWHDIANDPTYKLTNITRGDFDPYIRRWARAARAWGHPFFLRFAEEMNGAWTSWGTGADNPNGNTPADFVAAWRHVHAIFTQAGATNAIWVWSPNVLYSGATPYALDYPGDAYVDWIGLDGYNVGASEGWNGWTSLVTVFAASYRRITALTTKPLMIAETASTEVGGNKAVWIRQGFLTDLPTQLPRVRAVVWFDKNKETDWRVDSSAASLRAYRSVVAAPLYHGQIQVSHTTP